MRRVGASEPRKREQPSPSSDRPVARRGLAKRRDRGRHEETERASGGRPELPQSSQGGFGLLDARLAYEFLDGRALVALSGKNLTDEAYFMTANPLVPIFGFVTRFHGMPRSYGVELRYDFRPGRAFVNAVRKLPNAA